MSKRLTSARPVIGMMQKKPKVAAHVAVNHVSNQLQQPEESPVVKSTCSSDPPEEKEPPPSGVEKKKDDKLFVRACTQDQHCPGCIFIPTSTFLSNRDVAVGGCCGTVECS